MLGRVKLAGCLALLLAVPAFAQGGYRPSQQQSRRPAAAPRAPQKNSQPNRRGASQQPHNQPPRSQPPRNQPGHAGNWLRNYKDRSPDQQRRALQNDPQFRKLPAQRQTQLQNRLRNFSSLPPQQQERMLNRMETWEHLTPGQKQQARQVFHQFQQLPPNRRDAVNRAIRDMRNMTPEQRDRLINSDRYRSDFSPMERNILNGTSHLPLAPGDLQGAPPE